MMENDGAFLSFYVGIMPFPQTGGKRNVPKRE